MKIILAKPRGFCAGVEQSLNFRLVAAVGGPQ